MTMRALRGAKKKRAAPSGARQCAKRVLARKYEARSQSDRHKTYVVWYKKVSDRWEWSCTCPAFVYRKIEVSSCKHIEEVKKRNHCSWRSDVGPERSTKEVGGVPVCPRCDGATVSVESYEEDEP